MLHVDTNQPISISNMTSYRVILNDHSGERVRALVEPMMSLTQLSNCLTLEGSFSSVSTATIARKDAFCSIFSDLQDLNSFAPLESVE